MERICINPNEKLLVNPYNIGKMIIKELDRKRLL